MTVPKAELHVHIEGAATPALVQRIAARNGLRVPDGVIGEDGRFVWRDFLDFLNTYDGATSVIRTGRGLPRHRLRVPRELRRRGRDLRRDDRLGRPRRRRRAVRRGTSRRARPGDRRRAGGDRHRGPDRHELRAPLRPRQGARGRPPHGRGAASATSPASAWAATRRASRPATSPTPSRSPARAASASPSTPGSGRGPRASAAASRLGVSRIGHGVRAAEDPDLVRELADRGTVLEVCPTSNVVLGLYPSYADHPLLALRAAGVPVTLGIRRPALLGRLDRGGVRGRRGAVRARRRGAARDHADRAQCGLRGGGSPAEPPPVGLVCGRLTPRLP